MKMLLLLVSFSPFESSTFLDGISLFIELAKSSYPWVSAIGNLVKCRQMLEEKGVFECQVRQQ